jgi:hypothetical protein
MSGEEEYGCYLFVYKVAVLFVARYFHGYGSKYLRSLRQRNAKKVAEKAVENAAANNAVSAK